MLPLKKVREYPSFNQNCKLSCCRRIITAVPRKSTDCLQPILVGSCHRRMKMYAFSTVEGKCLAFSYTGCGGNEEC